MCDAANELKKCWEPRRGDRYYLKNDLYFTPDEKLSPIKGYKLYRKEGVYVISCNFDFGTKKDQDTIRQQSFWLPRQEEIQRLLKNRMGTNSSLIVNFKGFAFSYGRVNKYSMDALWLMFYYFEIHSKIWDGEKFKKVEKDLVGVWS